MAKAQGWWFLHTLSKSPVFNYFIGNIARCLFSRVWFPSWRRLWNKTISLIVELL